MRARILSIMVALVIGMSPMIASACDCDHGEKSAHGEQHKSVKKHNHAQCKDGTCANHKHKKHKKVAKDKCEPGASCVDGAAEKQESVTAPAPLHNVSGLILDSSAPVGFPVLTFLPEQSLVPAQKLLSVPLSSLTHALRI